MPSTGPLHLPPFHYAHITNENTNTTELVVGPLNRPLASHETVAQLPTPFVVVGPQQYCRVANPVRTVIAADTGAVTVVRDAYGQVQLRAGVEEYRYKVAPFPLYPDERLIELQTLQRLSATQALQILVLTAYHVEDKESGNGPDLDPPSRPIRREAGERYLFRGPGIYYPRVEEETQKIVSGLVIAPGTGLWCSTTETFTDTDTGIQQDAKERYLRFKEGLCFLQNFERSLSAHTGEVLTKDMALHVQVKRTYADPRPPFLAQHVIRREAKTFMVTGEDCACFIPHPYDKIVCRLTRLYVSASQYAVVLLGKEGPSGDTDSTITRTVRTSTSFFLQPGERLEGDGVREAFHLSADEAVLVTATAPFTDTNSTDTTTIAGSAQVRHQGDRWLVCGPRSFIPTDQMRVVPDALTGEEVRRRHLLDEEDGLYVRNVATGVVRLIAGPCSYLLAAEEELWEKPLPDHVAQHLSQLTSHAAYTERDEARRSLPAPRRSPQQRPQAGHAVRYSIPYRSVTQLYNYKTGVTRIIFGPDRVLLESEESFTVVSLSGSPWDPAKPQTCLPKQPHYITSLHLFLGPSNMTDVVHVETRDHAQLALQLCYDWYFDVAPGDTTGAKRCFSVNDFVGDCCSFIASRIRAAVASMPFEEFHKNSAECLRRAVFEVDPSTRLPNTVLRFPANALVITSVDTQAMEVLDERTRQGLQKSVKVAIELTTHAQEAEAQQVAMSREQQARGRLDRQRVQDQVENEERRRILLQAESNGLAIVTSGKSGAVAKALSTAAQIEGEATLEAAALRARKEGLLFTAVSDMQHAKKRLLEEQVARVMAMTESYEKEMSTVQQDLMAAVVAALGAETIAEVARAGPELQATLLKSLGLEGYLVTDGSSPINLFKTADGLLGHS